MDHAEAADTRDKLTLTLKSLLRESHIPTERISWLFPHLAPEDIAKFWRGSRFAVPATFVAGAYWQVYWLGIQLRATPMRLPSSFHADTAKHCGVTLAAEVQHIDSAVAFANNWEKNLVNDVARDAAIISAFHPNDANPLSVYAWLSAPFGELRSNEAFDAAVQLVTSDELEGREIVGVTPTHLLHCAMCLGPLNRARCENCNVDFPRIRNLSRSYPGKKLTLPQKVVETFGELGI